MASELDVPFEAIRKGLGEFAGIGRRLEQVGEAGGVRIIDDYGHHPAEIQATLRAVREAWPERRLVVLFQPHRYSRTRDLRESFHTAFYDADVLFLAPVYAAGEAPIAGVDSHSIGEGVRAHGHKSCEETNDLNDAVDRLQAASQPGDLIVTLGAGDVWKAGRDLLERLEKSGIHRREAG